MKPTTPATVEEILVTAELERRPTHLPDFRTESLALHTLAQDLAATPERVLSRLVHIARELCRAGSAGVSLVEKSADGHDGYRWTAVAGRFEDYAGKWTPRDISPCMVAQERNTHQLFSRPDRHFTWMADLCAPISEGLYFPLFADNRHLGTIWILSHDDGKFFDQEDVRILRGLAGFTSGALKMLRLVSSQQKSREEAEIAKTSYLNLLNSLSDVVVWESDPARKLSFISRSVERLFGFSRERWLNETDFLSQIVHPEDRATAALFFKSSLESSLSQEIEFRCVASDSQVLWLKHKVDVVRDGQTGTVRQLRGTMTDISKSKQIEIMLRDKEDFFREILRSLPVAIYVCDAQGIIRQWNSRAVDIWGREPKPNQNEIEFNGQFKIQDEAGSDIEYSSQPVATALRTGTTVQNVPITLSRQDGKTFALLVHVSAIKNSRNELAGVVCCFDESKSISIEAELRAAQDKLIAAGLFNPIPATSANRLEEAEIPDMVTRS